MKNNTLILIAGAALLFFLMKKKKAIAASRPADVMAVDVESLPNVELIKSQTVNFPQIAPSPSTVMDMPGSPNDDNYSWPGCSCESKGRAMSGMPFVC